MMMIIKCKCRKLLNASANCAAYGNQLLDIDMAVNAQGCLGNNIGVLLII